MINLCHAASMAKSRYESLSWSNLSQIMTVIDLLDYHHAIIKHVQASQNKKQKCVLNVLHLSQSRLIFFQKVMQLIKFGPQLLVTVSIAACTELSKSCFPNSC